MKKTPITDPIAIQELLWVRKDGKAVLITAKIGRPYKVGDGTWACPSELCGFESQYPDLHGVGSMQALGLALELIKMRLDHLLEDGENLCDPEDKKSVFDRRSLDAVFGK
jgi:hypothetical protein